MLVVLILFTEWKRNLAKLPYLCSLSQITKTRRDRVVFSTLFLLSFENVLPLKNKYPPHAGYQIQADGGEYSKNANE